MIDLKCLCCQEPFTPNKFHVNDQRYCFKVDCRKASHNAANVKWRADQKLSVPLRESHRKRNTRRGERFHLDLELSRYRKQLAHQQMILFGMLQLLSGGVSDDFTKTLSHCLDSGRELLRSAMGDMGGFGIFSCPGFGSCGGG